MHAHKKRQFLSLICDFYIKGRAHELNEYVLAYDVFARDNNYNPSADPMVRVVAHEIRKKLESYYQNEGANDEIRMELPAGSYQPFFHRRIPPATVELSESETPAIPKIEPVPRVWPLKVVTIILSVAVIGLAVTAIMLAVTNRTQREKAAALRDNSQYGIVWDNILRNSTAPVVVLSNPPVIRLSNPHEPDLPKKDSVTLSVDAMRVLRGRMMTNPQTLIGESKTITPDPRIVVSINSHTGLGEAIGLHYLTTFFRRMEKEIILKQSRTLSAEDLKNRNVIMLGGAWVNEWSGKLPDEEDFVYSVNATIVNRNPQTGEEREYVPQFEKRNGDLMTDFALITVKPNLTGANKVMVLSGIYSPGTEAAVEFTTDKNHLDHLNQRLKEANISGHFQVLLKVGVENGIPTRVAILAVHKLP
ncbi:MAG: hypothetical protein L0220_09765 [Acidobacteria bacterium]|nr:hypothetical protein [Acidobacteriota bacterium]